VGFTAANASLSSSVFTPSSHFSNVAGLALIQALAASVLLTLVSTTVFMMEFSMSWVNVRLDSSLPTFGQASA
jgi:hypothetical protein